MTDLKPFTLELREGGLVRVEPREAGFLMMPLAAGERDAYHWSRHAYLRREGAEAILDAAVARARLCGAPEVMARIFASAEPLELLVAARLVTRDEEDPRWEFHDLLYHQQSTRSDSLRRYGATYRFEGQLRPPEAVQLGLEEPVIALDSPESEQDRSSLAGAMHRRRSGWQHGASPVNLRELGQFLGLALRRLPSAGGLNELAFYLAVRHCDGLGPGLYRYDGATHQLGRVRHASQSASDAILARAGLAWGTGKLVPQALVLIAGQIPVQAWKYEGIAYRNTLLDTGVALEAMYLASSALGLAGCALGWNEPAMLASATGIDILRETAIAAFVIGTQAVFPNGQ